MSTTEWVVTDPRLKTFIRRQLAPFVTKTWYEPVLSQPPTAISECMRETAIPYFVMLGMFGKRSFAVLIDEAALNMFQIPVVAEKAFFTGVTIFQGELTWEFLKLNANATLPRQVFFVHRFFRLAGRNVPPDATWVSIYALIQSTFDTQGKDICFQPRRWPDKARELAQQGKIVCLGTKDCLTFQPKRWFAIHEKAVMERSYLPSLRWLYDKDNYLLCSNNLQLGFSSLRNQPFFLLVERVGTEEWRIFAREDHNLVDMTLTGIRNKPLLCMPNEILLRHDGNTPVIALFRATECDDGIECEVVALRPERRLPDTIVFLEHVLERNLNLA